MKSQSYASYWRNSLADSAFNQGGFNQKEIQRFHKRPFSELETGIIGSEFVSTLFKDKSKDTKSIDVTIRPIIAHRILEHGQSRNDGLPAIVTPLILIGSLARDGRLFLTGGTIPRDLLEPVGHGSFAIGTIEDLDYFASTISAPVMQDEEADAHDRQTLHSKRWNDFCDYYNTLLKRVTGDWPNDDSSYRIAERWYFEEADKAVFASANILKLYDHFRQSKTAAPLFDRYASEQVLQPEPCLSSDMSFATRLGHSNDTLALAKAQRDVVSHNCSSANGDIIAVNGPPGTGKTTMLLSIIAVEWARAAIRGKEPPVILAASTNNQAVTNILDAFAKGFSKGSGPLSGRWLPELKSFGIYLPSQAREEEARKKYQTETFLQKIETSDYVTRAKAAFIAAGARAFPDLRTATVETILKELKSTLNNEADKLQHLQNAWSSLSAARDKCLAILSHDPQNELAARKHKARIISEQKNSIDTLNRRWDEYQAQEPLLLSAFGWLPVVAKKRMQKARVFLRDIWPQTHILESFRTFDEIEKTIKADVRRLEQELILQNQAVSQAQSLMHTQEQCQKQWDNTLTSIGLPLSNDFSEVDAETDKLVRFKIFLLTTHYWEGRWLLEMLTIMPDIEKEQRKTGSRAIKARWRRRMMLTPCAVSTLAMLPKKLIVRQPVEKVFTDNYLYNFIDLLIIDEAGQVLPEVAGASFTLAKKAIVIGDMRQIEPIWAVSQRVDLGNLLGSEIIEGEITEQSWENLKATGKLASSGSVMQVAQQACRYHYDTEMERGFYLYEHHRCLTEIINYCNELSYQGKLQPKRVPDTEPPFPPMAYLHVNGFCRTSGTSRVNHLEAETIALWLAENKQDLEKKYGQSIEDIVGVVTPFAAQSRTIINACQKHNIAAGSGKKEVTVGTVHALQGAERAIIIFSSVYSKHEDGSFIDRSKSMLNVAVSRAKDSFLLFGDMDVFASTAPGTPRGLLSSYMFAREENVLPFTVPARSDLQEGSSELFHLQNAEEHDEFLLQTLSLKARNIHIVSPWINLKPMQQLGFLKAFQEAVLRGTRIYVYIDPELNADYQKNGASLSYNDLRLVAETLTNIGVTVLYVRKTHSKIVIVDDKILSVGSFNWLSADRKGKYARHETSLVYKGNTLNNEIKIIQESLEQRKVSEPFLPN